MTPRAPDFIHPPVHTTESGVRQVAPSDILRSAVGQAVIRRVAAMNLPSCSPAKVRSLAPDPERPRS